MIRPQGVIADGILPWIERARKAQQDNEQRHDVQQEIPYLTDCDPGDENDYKGE